MNDLLAVAVVDAAAIGITTDEWLGYTALQRAAITREHNARARKR